MNPCKTDKIYADDFAALQYKTAMENWGDEYNPYKYKIFFIAILWYTILVMMIMYMYALYKTITTPIATIYKNKTIFNLLIATTIFYIISFTKLSNNFWHPLKYYVIYQKYNKYKHIKDCIFQLQNNN